MACGQRTVQFCQDSCTQRFNDGANKSSRARSDSTKAKMSPEELTAVEFLLQIFTFKEKQRGTKRTLQNKEHENDSNTLTQI